MSGPLQTTVPVLGPDLPNLEVNLDAPAIPPSSLTYNTWAASCPEEYLPFEVDGQTIHARAKRCPFCADPIQLGPGGDGSLVQHMLSRICQAMQREIEIEVHNIMQSAQSNTGSNPAPSPLPDVLFQETLSSSSALHVSAPSPPLCHGARLKLSKSLWANYPWHLHDPTHGEAMPFFICGINQAGDDVHIRSRDCAVVVSQPGKQSCIPCAEQLDSRELKRVIERVLQDVPANGLNLRYYSHKQLAELIETRNEQLKQARLRGIVINRNSQRLSGKLDDHKQLLIALAESDDVAVARLVNVALRQGCSAAAIVERLKKTVDVALLVLRIGGPRLLFALSKALNLPSLSTVYRHAERAYLRPSVSSPTLEEVLANIQSVCGRAQSNIKRGFTLMIDEIALEERLRYCYAEDAIVGLCREHGSVCDTRNMTGRPISHLVDLKELLDAGKCHRAKEATLVAVAPFGASDYTPMAVLISGTCKTESAEDQLKLIRLVLAAWAQSPFGQILLGLIWSIATDGDACRRQALHALCLSRLLPPTSPLYRELGQLKLFNLYCGEGDITHDGDFKHEEKRFASALRSDAGLFVNGTHITPAIIKQHLRHVPTLSDRIDSLFDNSDRQNVPKAHALLKGIYDASQVPEVWHQAANREFVLLARLLYSFYAPQTIPSLSLSQQVVHISKCAFMLFAIFRIDGTRFISSQLYYDIQASIKNAMFCIAKTKVLNPSLPFYMLQLGDDRLEGLFGVYRTTSNNRNPDLLGMAKRSAAAQEVNNILTAHPNYDRKPYRLSLESASGIDHLNPASWSGDVCVGNVVLRTSWAEGLAEAKSELRRAGITPDFDPNTLRVLAGGRDVDLMRPWGDYVGVTDPQISGEELSTATQPAPVPGNESGFEALDLVPETPPNFIDPSPDDISLFSDVELPLESLLEPCMPGGAEIPLHMPSESAPHGWVKVRSRWIHLESATRVILGTDATEKSADRLRRVRAYTRYPSIGAPSDSIVGDLCLIGQPILGLVRCGDEVALAAARVTSIWVGTKRSQVESISVDHLSRPDVALTGQILALDFCNGSWRWNGSHITSSSNKRKTNTPAGRGAPPLLVDFKAATIEPVSPELSEYRGRLVWSFKHLELVAATDLLWSKSSENRQNIPIILCDRDFPYDRDEVNNSNHRLIHHDASEAVQGMPAERSGLCYLCGHFIPIKQYMRTHVAKHIIAKQRRIEDPLLNSIIAYAPCGFCGRSGTCKTTLRTNASSSSIISNCPFFDKFSLRPAAKSTSSSPCTNRPIMCGYPGCEKQEPIWSYNMREHILSAHGRSAFDRVVNMGEFDVAPEEIELLQLNKPLTIPGRRAFILPSGSITSAAAKRSIEAAFGPTIGGLDSQVVEQGPGLMPAAESPVASGSGSKRVRLG